MNRLIRGVAIAAAVMLVGCAAPRPIQIFEPFDAAAAAKALLPGTNTARGNALMRQKGGGIVTCAGFAVQLFPFSHYAERRMIHIYGNAQEGVSFNRLQFEPDYPQYRALSKSTKCDSQGNFQFEGLADGEYFIALGIEWEVGGVRQGGALMKRYILRGGQVVSHVLAG